MHSYLQKMKGGSDLPPKQHLRDIFWSWCGGAFSIGTIAFIANATNQPILMAPLGASAVLAFGVPSSPLAQPRNIIGGHLLTAVVGVIFLMILGDAWWAMGLAVATSIAGMQLTRTVHPPAGANPLIVMFVGAGWEFILLPTLAGAALLTLCAVLFNNLASGRRYPLYWH